MRTLVIVPTYNEMENISSVLSRVLSIKDDIDILVIDDNSADGTGKYVRELSRKERRVKLHTRPAKLGLGTAYIEGFRYAVREEYDYIFEMDADLSHNPDDIPRFLERIKNVDLVIGSRYSDGVSVVNWPISRLLLSYFANMYARIVTGVPIKDMTSGYKCYRRKVVEMLLKEKIVSDGYSFQIETVFWAYRNNFKVKELPIIFTDRVEGSSKMSKRIVWEAFWVVWRLRLMGIKRKVRRIGNRSIRILRIISYQ
ncbi:MAG: polyprenol monophosphomannose synthase [candidate division WOR-3 bacterium]|nr:polyprenol monophosphomannose synthase [candidate division WOR-3 bacterium]